MGQLDDFLFDASKKAQSPRAVGVPRLVKELPSDGAHLSGRGVCRGRGATAELARNGARGRRRRCDEHSVAVGQVGRVLLRGGRRVGQPSPIGDETSERAALRRGRDRRAAHRVARGAVPRDVEARPDMRQGFRVRAGESPPHARISLKFMLFTPAWICANIELPNPAAGGSYRVRSTSVRAVER